MGQTGGSINGIIASIYWKDKIQGDKEIDEMLVSRMHSDMQKECMNVNVFM